MPPLDTTELVAISRRVSREIDPRLHVEGVTSADGGGGRAELLVSVTGCHAESCYLVLNLDRTDAEHVRHDLATKLSAALAEHLFP